MKFLADENIPTLAVALLRKQGHDVKDIKAEKLHGLPDAKVLALAVRENRILITLDKECVYK
jgi:predicted nuclease of predicted toxin-antitoxin system